MSANGHIVAMGGGGFSMEPDNPLLDDYVLSLAGKSSARVCFVPTASADSWAYTLKFYRAFSGRAIASDLTLFGSPSLPRNPPDSSELLDFVMSQDIIYVGGGNTVNLLAVWRAHGLDQILRKAYERGIILCGVSAGMLCWFEGGLTDSFGELAALHDGLGILMGSVCPHYDGEPGRPEAYRRAIASGLSGGYAADDGAALHFHGTELVGAISSRPNALAYRVEPSRSGVVEVEIETRYLGIS